MSGLRVNGVVLSVQQAGILVNMAGGMEVAGMWHPRAKESGETTAVGQHVRGLETKRLVQRPSLFDKSESWRLTTSGQNMVAALHEKYGPTLPQTP